jgi:hypothetical protein
MEVFPRSTATDTRLCDMKAAAGRIDAPLQAYYAA